MVERSLDRSVWPHGHSGFGHVNLVTNNSVEMALTYDIADNSTEQRTAHVQCQTNHGAFTLGYAT